VEFHLALLDRRFLAGDAELFDRLNTKVLPGSESKPARFFSRNSTTSPKTVWRANGNTIFHLEPNVKEAPGGLRDYQAAIWLARSPASAENC